MTGRQHSIVPHKANYFFIPLEDDYLAMYEAIAEELDPIKEEQKLKLSGPSDCKAMIASILEAWMNSKRPTAKCEEDLYVYLTYDEWEQALRYRYKRSTIIQCLKEMEAEGYWTDESTPIKEYQGTIKKRHFVQNTFEYQLNLPVVLGLLSQLPEQSPFEQKPKPSLGRPRKNHSKINGLNKNGLNSDDRDVKINDGSVKTDDSRVKTNAPFYTQTTHTKQTDTESAYSVAIETKPQSADAPHTPLFVHPVLSHLSFDDLLHPTVMVVELIPDNHPWWLEGEEKHRMRTGEEMAQLLKAQGHPVHVEFVYKSPTETVEATPYVPDNLLQVKELSPALDTLIAEVDDLEDTAKRAAIRITPKGATNDASTYPHSSSGVRQSASTASEPATQTEYPQSAEQSRAQAVATEAESGVSAVAEAVSAGNAPITAEFSTQQASSPQARAKVETPARPVHPTDAGVDITTLSLKAHTTYVFYWLDEIKRELERDIHASYVQNQTNLGLMRDLIAACWNTDKELTRDNIRLAWTEMWNEPTGSKGFTWKGKITIRALCNSYGDYLDRARQRIAPPEKQESKPREKTALEKLREQEKKYLKGAQA